MDIKEIEEEWDYPNADELDWNKAKDAVDYLLSRIKELEERIELAEATRDDALGYAKGYRIRAEELEAELAKIKSDPSIGKLEIEEWPKTPNY